MSDRPEILCTCSIHPTLSYTKISAQSDKGNPVSHGLSWIPEVSRWSKNRPFPENLSLVHLILPIKSYSISPKHSASFPISYHAFQPSFPWKYHFHHTRLNITVLPQNCWVGLPSLPLHSQPSSKCRATQLLVNRRRYIDEKPYFGKSWI